MPEEKQLILKTRNRPRMISLFPALPVKYRTHLNDFFLYLFHLNLNIRAHKPGCSGACQGYEVSRPSLLLQNPMFQVLFMVFWVLRIFLWNLRWKGLGAWEWFVLVGIYQVPSVPLVSSQGLPTCRNCCCSWSFAVIGIYPGHWMILSLVWSFMEDLPIPFRQPRWYFLYSKAGYVIVHNSCSVVHHSKGWL